MKYINIHPLGEISEDLLHSLGTGITDVYGFSYRIGQPVELSESSYFPEREQYNAQVIAVEAAKKIRGAENKLIVVDIDLFVPGLNFVFGIAKDNIAIESLVRLRPEYYGDTKNESLFIERALKEAIHELGHTFGMHHCPDKGCVMHFSNSLEDTDIKGPGFCRYCSIIINRKLY